MSTEQNDNTSQGSGSIATNKFQVLLEKQKRRLADFLKLQTQRLTVRQQKVVLIGTGMIAGAACLLLMMGPFIGGSQKSQPPETGSMPSVLIKPNSPALSEQDYQMLRGFVRTIDSLQYYDPLSYQEAMKGREGLVDSIRIILAIKP